MELERTGINEPPVVEELLCQAGFSSIENHHIEPHASHSFFHESLFLEAWVLYGELELIHLPGSPILLAGDRFRLKPGESLEAKARIQGCGYISGTGPLQA